MDVATKAPNDQRLVYSIYIGLASLYEARHQYTDAEQQYECAYTAAKTAFGGESEEVAKPSITSARCDWNGDASARRIGHFIRH